VTASIVLVVVFAAVALGLSCLALWFAWGARSAAREALASAHRHIRTPRPPGESELRTERREVDEGPPEGEPERRRRHRAPETDRYSRLRASADARETAEPAAGPSTPSGSSPAYVATAAIPRVRPEDLATVEHPAPDTRFRRPPPPPLPRPGSIGRPQ
jgi:hypothetical protein